MLKGPAQQHLCWRVADACRDAAHWFVGEVAAGAQRTVGLDGDTALQRMLEHGAAILERAELHLIDHRRNCGCPQHLVQLANAEVGNANGACIPELTRALHARPRSGRTTLRPVNQVQIDIVRSEPLQAALSLGDEDLLAWHAALAERLPDAFLLTID